MALREIIAFFGFEYDKSKLDSINKGVGNVKANLGDAAGPKGLGAFVTGLQGALAAVTGGVFLAFTEQIKDQAAALQDTADQTGLATDEIQAWTLAANLGGASAQDFVAGLRKLSKELATGVDESGQQSKLFKNLGIDARDSEKNVRDLSDVLPEIAEKFAGLKTGAERTALATQIFGKAGSKLVPVLSKGAAGVAELRADFEALGGGFSKEAIERADAYDDALIKLNFSFFGLKSLLATSVFPILENVIGSVTKAVVASTKWLKETTLLESGVSELALTIGAKLGMALAPYLKSGLKFAAIFLAIDDVVAFLQGKDSLIGALLNKAFGEGTATAVRAWANDGIAAIKGMISGGFDLLKIAVSSNSAEIDSLGDHFFTVTAGINNAIDKLVAKIKGLAEAWGLIPKVGDQGNADANGNTQPAKPKGLGERAADFLGFSGGGLSDPNSLAAKEQKRNEAIAAARRAAANPFDAKAAADLLTGAKGNAGTTATAPTVAAPVTNTTNNFPVKVDVTIKGSATEKDVRAGVNAGLADYRAAVQNLEQRR